MKNKLLLAAIVFGSLFSSCKKDEIIPNQQPQEVNQPLTSEIGVWDMTDREHIHFFTETSKVKKVEVTIVDDENSMRVDVYTSGGTVIQDGVICIYRDPNGWFNADNFSNPEVNRGKITVYYE